MLKRLGMFLGLFAVVTAGWLLVQSVFSDSPEESTQITEAHNSPSANGTDVPQNETLDLALKTINLSQGEGGFELWRLKAEWANVQKRGDNILVEQPRLTYFSRNENEQPLYVSSSTGSIHQKSQILRFIHNVRIIKEDKTMDGELLIYNGTSKTMTFPQGGVFSGTGVSGSANHVEWEIDKNTILATGDVAVLMESRADLAAPPGGSSSGTPGKTSVTDTPETPAANTAGGTATPSTGP